MKVPGSVMSNKSNVDYLHFGISSWTRLGFIALQGSGLPRNVYVEIHIS